MIIKASLILAAAACVTSVASAGQIAISDIGGGIVLNSGPLASTILGGSETVWTTESLAAVHASMNASGIVTNGRITIAAADTSHGLTLMALIDNQLVEGTATMGHVHMDSVANGANLAFVKDTGGLVTVSALSANSRIASGNFAWNSNGGGDAFAWAGLATGNSTIFRFNRIDGMPLGLNAAATFQFVNWNGNNWNSIVLPDNVLSFTQSNDFGFSAAVMVPAPSTLTVAGVPLLALSLIRRRRAR